MAPRWLPADRDLASPLQQRTPRQRGGERAPVGSQLVQDHPLTHPGRTQVLEELPTRWVEVLRAAQAPEVALHDGHRVDPVGVTAQVLQTDRHAPVVGDERDLGQPELLQQRLDVVDVVAEVIADLRLPTHPGRPGRRRCAGRPAGRPESGPDATRRRTSGSRAGTPPDARVPPRGSAWCWPRPGRRARRSRRATRRRSSGTPFHRPSIAYRVAVRSAAECQGPSRRGRRARAPRRPVGARCLGRPARAAVAGFHGAIPAPPQTRSEA